MKIFSFSRKFSNVSVPLGENKMETLEGCSLNDMTTLDDAISPDSSIDDTFEDVGLKSLNESLKPTDSSQSNLEIHQICRGCLRVTNVCNMQNILIDGCSSVTFYEDLTKVKVEGDDIPTMMCSDCLNQLSKLYMFIKMLKHSYTILLKATKEIETLNKCGQTNWERHNIKQTAILRKVLEERFTVVEDVKKIESEPTKNEQNVNENALPDYSGGNSSVHCDSGSSDDEIPLSERFGIDVSEEKKYIAIAKKVKKRNMKNGADNKALSKKRGQKSKENLKNVPNNTVPSNEKLIVNASKMTETFGLPDICPLCGKKVRRFVKHLHSLHSLDWNNSKCLRCPAYQNTEKAKLIEHSKACTGMELEQSVIQSEELKLELMEEMNDANDCDPDFEPDEPDKVDTKYLDYEEDELHESKERRFKKIRHRNKNFSCCKCEDVVFKSYDEAEFHLKTVHSDESKCILCEQDFTNSFSLLYHMMVKHGKLKCCRLCLVSFKNSDELSAHYKSEEHNTKCTVCGEQFRNRKAVYEHRRKKHLNPQPENQKYKCPECPKEFANQNNIRRHVLVAHNDLRFLCDTCGQSYTTKRNLKLHIQKFHEGVQVQNKTQKKNFFCEACGKELKIFHKYAIALHRAKHKGHSFVCKKCYDSFPTEDIFKKHVEDLGHHLYECNKCQSQFVREENFKIHLKNHEAPGWNKNMFATWGVSAKLRNEKGEFVCSYCPKVFKDKQRLDNHVRVHTNERPYKCHICSKGFKTWIHRKTHLNIHLGIKKWVCKYCSKAFTNSCTLKGHEMLHTGERPHRCPECKKGFITMSAMKKHRMIHFRTGANNYGKKDKPHPKEEDKTDSEHEENTDLFYKYGQMFSGSDVSYESFTDPPKESVTELVSIEKELSC